MAIYLQNAEFIDWKTLEFSKTDILVKEGNKGEIDFFPTGSRIPDDCIPIDCTGKYVTKAFANGHHHAYSALAMGMPAPKKSPGNFHEILKYIWWNLDKNLNKELIEISALTTAMESAKSGVSFIIDHHASPFAVEGSLEIIAKAFDRVGVSHLLCFETSDRDGMGISEKGLDETSSYLQKHQGLVGLHASFTVSDDTFRKAIDIAGKFNSGLHIHVAEDEYDQQYNLHKYHKRVITRMKELGALQSPKTILGHCLHLNDAERNVVGHSKTWVVQNTESNLNNRVGFFNSVGLGQNIMLGTDGMHSDMLRSAKAAFFVGQNFDTIDYPSAYKRFRNVHTYLKTNGFSGDSDNNLVVMDYKPRTDFSQENFYGHFIFGLEAKHIQHVISDGKLLVEDRKMITVNENEIIKQSRELSKVLWKRMGK
jgi:cytosine/adenosine deaminase-related metal-dependent hydrolase